MTTYYVSAETGSNSNNGTTDTTALATLQAAANLVKAGDTVEVMNGTYTTSAGGDVLQIETSGTANAPITFEAMPGQTPVINSSGGWNAVLVQASYIVIDGFTVVGDAASVTKSQDTSSNSVNDPVDAGNGIYVTSPGGGVVPNHVTIENNTVDNEPGGGIGSTGSDYIQVLDNTVYDNAHWSGYANSGISIASSVNSDTLSGVHSTISGNISYDNTELVGNYYDNGTITDGEGIILDTNSGYTSEILVQDNTAYGDSGAGIESFLTNNAVINGNTVYGDLSNPLAANNGEIFINSSTNNTVTNNTGRIAFSAPGTATAGVGKSKAITGISIAETGTTSGETFTVTLTDTNGALSATGSGISGSGSTTLSVTGSLSAVNTVLATLKDADSTSGTDTISLNATDSFGNSATLETIAVTANGLPTITAPGVVAVGVSMATVIAGISISESGTTAGETFTVTLTDTNGALSATGATGNGSASLSVTGSLGTINTALATLSDTDGTLGADTIKLNATDSFGNVAAQQTIAVTANGLLTITAPATTTAGVGQSISIAGVSVAESGTIGGETFTVTLTDTNGALSATGATGNGSATLTITGSLATVNTDLASLSDTDGTPGSDTIKLNATDSVGNVATQQTIAVTANGLPTISVPGAIIAGVGKAMAMSGISLAETGTTSGETFTVTLTDTNGALSATGATGNGSATLSVSGSLGTVNAALATLSDTDGTAGSDTIKLNATDSFGNVATQQTIAVTVNGLPTITAPGTVTAGVGKAKAISGISLAEAGTTSGETFTVTLTDTNGDLSATGATGNGSATLTVSGSLGTVNADLATLSDTDGTAGSDTIKLNASDSFGNVATQQTIAVTVNGLPTIAAPGTITAGVGKAMAISGISLAEAGTTSGETFTVTLTDTNGALSATGATGNGSASLTIMGSLGTVNADLATLSDTDGTAGSDTIKLNATDSFGNVATQQTIAVTVNGLPTIAAPGTITAGVGKAMAISGISLAEAGTTSGETFTVTLTDTNGNLSSTGATGNGSASLTIMGSLGTVNTDLATLSDTDGTSGADTIRLNATDSFGNVATQQTIAVTVNGLPTITAPGTVIAGVGKAMSISGISLAEAGTTSGENFTVTLSDTNGDLSATGATGNGSANLTVTGSLGTVNADLATLSDTDGTTGADTIRLNVTDSFSNVATQQTIALMANGLPTITAPGTITAGVGKAMAISGISLAEAGTTSGETFTVTLTDTNGDLSATGATGIGSASLSVTGSLGTVNADLATLTDTDGTTGADTIRLNATDSFGNVATQQTIAVTANALPTIAAPGTVIAGVGKAVAIGGISLAETGTTSGETFTVTITDTNGALSATGATGDGSASLTIMGSLGTVNTDLATLSDTDGTPGADTIRLNATDSFGNVATQQTIAVTVNGLPTIAAPGAVIAGVGKAVAISGISLAEAGTTSGETFTVTLTDTNGDLSATGATGNGSASLTVTGSLGTVNADLAALSDTDGTTGADTIRLNATDSFSNVATQQTIALMANGLPTIAAPGAVIAGVGKAVAIGGISLAEAGTTSGETFTVTLADTNGNLSATGATGNGSASLTIMGSLGTVNADLATLTDTDGTSGTDTIRLNATDSFGNVATQQTIAVTVNGLPTISVPGAVTAGVGEAVAIGGVSLAEAGTTSGETFTVTLTDTNGDLSATGATGSGTTGLTIMGSLGTVNTDLATLTDTDGTSGPDTIVLNATDSFGNGAIQQTIAVIACYLRGTLVSVAAGEVPIEQLRVGDVVATLRGPRPIRWIGRRRYVLAQTEGHDAILPVLIRAGAIDDALPRRDLYVSPEHALYLDGVLIAARHLTNGRSIVRCNAPCPAAWYGGMVAPGVVEYFHLELAEHAVMFAEALPAETFVDCDSRAMFDNARSYMGGGAPVRTFCAPRLEHGPELEAIRRRINGRAGIEYDGAPGPLIGNLERCVAKDPGPSCFVEGWAQDAAAPERPVWLEFVADGIPAGVVLANRHRSDLEAAGLGSGRHAFRVALARKPERIEVRRMSDGAALAGALEL